MNLNIIICLLPFANDARDQETRKVWLLRYKLLEPPCGMRRPLRNLVGTALGIGARR